MKMLKAAVERLRGLSLHQWVQTIVGAWCLLVAGLLLTGEGHYYDLPFQQHMSLPVAALWMLLIVEVVLLVSCLFPRARAEGYVLVFGALTVAVLLAAGASSTTRYYLYYALAALLAILLFYACTQGLLTLPHLRVGRVSAPVIAGVVLALSAAGMATVGALRYLSYNAPNFDFGIFAQMFHYMKETGLPLATCERDGLLSHFAVHISPIYYLLLPFYAVFPSPVTLAIGQGVIIASGGIPLYLLARKYGLSYKQTLFVIAAYAAYPALSCGVLYDLHENCFLAPLLLWMFYAYECRRTWALVLTTVLVLMVKEDAAVYVALFALYQAVAQRRERLRCNAALFFSAVLWFAVAVLLLDQFGDGAMTARYAAFQYNGSGLFGMVKTLIVNPGLFVTKAFAPVDSGTSKVRYLAQLVLPLGVALFTTRRPSRLLLLLPILLNLFSSSPYQCDLTFQYSFGVSAFLFYLCLLNLRDRPPVSRRAMVSFMAASSLLLYIVAFVPSIRHNVTRYVEKREVSQQMTAELSVIPDDASVTCSTFLLPHLAQREVVYEDYYHNTCDTDYLVLDLRKGYVGKGEEAEQKWADAGYVVCRRVDDLVLIMQRGE